MTRSAVIIYNPGSGRRRGRHQAVSQMVELLQPRGLSVEPRATAAPGDATRLSRDALAAGVQTIVVHGGDGTVNEALQPLVGGPTPLAVWPGGTANVLARELALPGDLEGVADMIAAGRTRRVSVGRAGSRYFLVMAGVGLDAALVRAVNPRLKRLTGQGAFWIAWLQQLIRWQPQPFMIEVDGQRYGATFTVLANAASYGGGLRIAPASQPGQRVPGPLSLRLDRSSAVCPTPTGWHGGHAPRSAGRDLSSSVPRHGLRERRRLGPGGWRAARRAADDVRMRAGGAVAGRAVMTVHAYS